MLRWLPVAGLWAFLSTAAFALELPPTDLAYQITASFDPATRRLDGTVELRWRNRTGRDVAEVPLHLYLNAFSHSHSTWLRDPENFFGRFDLGDFLVRNPDPWGYTDLVAVRQRFTDGAADAAWRFVQPDDGNALDRTLAAISLPRPVAPDHELLLSIQFSARLPVTIARTGGQDDFFLFGQWFPKLGVIERPGLRGQAHQFHAAAEFFAEFADFDVTLTVPTGWLVGATGRQAGEPAPAGAGLVRRRYTQRAVHDFALVAGAHLTAEVHSFDPPGGGPTIDITYIVPAGTQHQIPRWRQTVETAIEVLAQRVGPYPYDTLTVVLVPRRAERAEGMEYPTFFTGSTGDRLWDRPLFSRSGMSEFTLAHEFCHEYFYAIVASDEQEEAYLDEGFASYWDAEVMAALARKVPHFTQSLGRAVDVGSFRAAGLAETADMIDEAVHRSPAWLYKPRTVGVQTYPRAASILFTAAGLFGPQTLDCAFASYYERFAFKHPTLEDFLAAAQDAGGPEMEDFLREAFAARRIPNFKVEKATTEAYEPPLGRVNEAGPEIVTPATRGDEAGRGLPEWAQETDGRVVMEISDPGFNRGGVVQPGSIRRRPVAPEQEQTKNEPGQALSTRKEFFVSKVRVSGPSWDHLPADVEFRFADGVIVRDPWDGRAPWRGYRFVRPARLETVVIDPVRKIDVDPWRDDNSLSVAPAPGFARRWGAWFASLAQWLAAGASLWL